MQAIQKLLGRPILVIFFLVLVITALCVFLYYKNNEELEGFYPVNEERINYEREVGKRRYNDFADMTDPGTEGIVPKGNLGDELLRNVLGTADYEGNSKSPTLSSPTFTNEIKYKAVSSPGEVTERIKMCERVTKWNCEALGDPLFQKYCGICSSKGKTHLGAAHVGGLYIDPQIREKDIAEATAAGKPYESVPTAGLCGGEFYVDRAVCHTQQDRDDCAKAQSFDDMNAKAKCALCANSPGGNLFVYVGSRGNQDDNFTLRTNPIPFKVRLRFAVTHPAEATIAVTRTRDQKNIVGSFIIGTNTYIADIPDATENEYYNIVITYPEYKDHNYTTEEINRFKLLTMPKYAPLTNAMFGPVVDGEGGFLKDDVRAIDVSDYIKDKYKVLDCSKTRVTVSPEALGRDPAPGSTKQLRMTYSNDGVDFAYSFGREGTVTEPVNTKSFDTLCPQPIPIKTAEKQVCENDAEGNLLPDRIYIDGKNQGYTGSSAKAKCIEALPPKERGLVGIWESLGRVPRTIPIDITVKKVNGYEVGEEGVNTLGTIRGSRNFKNLVTPGMALGIPSNLFWFWAKRATQSSCEFNVQVPATLRDPTVPDDLKLCPTGPLIVTKEAAKNLKQGSCDKLINGKPQGPGNYSDDCIRSLFLSTGCTRDGRSFPNSSAKIKAYTTDALSNADNDIDTISEKMDETYAIATTGNNLDGLKMEQTSYIKANLDCFGISVTNPCDTPFKETGPHKPDCLDYLFTNAGKDNPTVGQTYPSMFNRSSGTGRNDKTPIMYCQRTGSLAPIGADGQLNMSAIAEANSYGSVTSVRDFYKQVHYDANLGTNQLAQQKALLRCYGVGVKAPDTACKGVFARYVVVRPAMYNNNNIQISQLEVYDVTGKLISKNGKTTSSRPSEGTQSKSAVDGRPKIRESPDLFIAENDRSLEKNKSFWMLDLGKRTEISYIVYYNRASQGKRSVGMRIQLLDENEVVVKQKVLTGGDIETVLFSNIKPAGLLQTGNKVKLSPGKYGGAALTIVAGGEVLIQRSANPAASSFITLPGNSPTATSFSFKHATSEKYLRVQGFRVRVSEDDRTNTFKNESSFIVVESLAGNPGEVSYESVSSPGSYLGVSSNMGVYITQADSAAKKAECSWNTVTVA